MYKKVIRIGDNPMKIFKKGLVLYLILALGLAFFSACSPKTADSSVGEYLFVSEDGPIVNHDYAGDKMVLDGFGGGEYHHKGNVHKIKYTFDNPNISITDDLTGIKYTGTLTGTDLLLYDGNPNTGLMTSEFLFRKKSAY